jgi:hypothetical protein
VELYYIVLISNLFKSVILYSIAYMEVPEELKKLARNLSVPEKRFIKIQSKSRSGTDTQVFKLFDWLNRASDNEQLPPRAEFTNNLPTLAARLRSIILNSLYLLHKDDNVEMRLTSMLSDVHLLQSKKLYSTAARQLKKAKKLAYEFSRYGYVQLFIQNEKQLAQKLPVDEFALRIEDLQKEEKLVQEQLQQLSSLQHTHDQLIIMLRKFPFSLDPEVIQHVKQLAEVPETEEAMQSSAFLENALAVSILGIRDMFIRDPDASVPRYQKLIRRWQKSADWQIDQSQLLLTVCKYYQNACIFSPVDHEKINADLAFLEGFGGLPKEDMVAMQDLLYSNQFAMAINTGKFDVVIPMIGEIEQWLDTAKDFLAESQLYPYYCNFAVAEFLAGNFTAASKKINRIITFHNRKDRLDIYEFALVLRTVLQYELGNEPLNENVIRSGKRHFQKNKAAADFELMVMRYITQLADAGNQSEKKVICKMLKDELGKFSASLPATIPLLGLNEVIIWAESKEQGISIRESFLKRVEARMRLLEGMKKISG